MATPLDTDELVALRDALVRARGRGVRSTLYDGKRVEYGSDADMASAIADLERRIARGSGRSAPRVLRFSTSKGV